MTRTGASRRRAAPERVAGRARAAVAAIAGLGGYEATACFKDDAGPLSVGQFARLQARVHAFGRPPVGLADGPGSDRSVLQSVLGAHADYCGEAYSALASAWRRLLSSPVGLDPYR